MADFIQTTMLRFGDYFHRINIYDCHFSEGVGIRGDYDIALTYAQNGGFEANGYNAGQFSAALSEKIANHTPSSGYDYNDLWHKYGDAMYATVLASMAVDDPLACVGVAYGDKVSYIPLRATTVAVSNTYVSVPANIQLDADNILTGINRSSGFGIDRNDYTSFKLCGAMVNSRYLVVFLLVHNSNSDTTTIQAPLYTIDTISIANKDFSYDVSSYSPTFGEPSAPDGYGENITPSFDSSSDTIGIPDMPEIGISSAGFVNVYHVSQGALNNLGNIIFPAINLPAAAPTDVTEALTSLLQYCQFFVDSLQNGKLIDYVVDCHIIPVAPADGAAATIHVGYKDTEISAPRVSSDYVDFDCGSLSIGEYYANYIDYLTRARLFLPFVGFVDLKPEFWQSGVINVRYRFNIIDGSFMAYVKSTSSKSNLSDTVIGQYGGNSCVHIPLTGLNYSSFISGLVTGSMSLAASAASGNAAGAASSALSMLNNKPEVAQSNNYNASTSFLGVRCPYLMIERPVASFATEYARDKGLPLNVTVSLNNVSGYTVIDNIDFIGFDAATMDEVEEIRTLLQSGVIF